MGYRRPKFVRVDVCFPPHHQGLRAGVERASQGEGWSVFPAGLIRAFVALRPVPWHPAGEASLHHLHSSSGCTFLDPDCHRQCGHSTSGPCQLTERSRGSGSECVIWEQAGMPRGPEGHSASPSPASTPPSWEAREEGAEPECTGHGCAGCLPHLLWEGACGLVCARAPWPRGYCPRLHAGLFPQLPPGSLCCVSPVSVYVHVPVSPRCAHVSGGWGLSSRVCGSLPGGLSPNFPSEFLCQARPVSC